MLPDGSFFGNFTNNAQGFQCRDTYAMSGRTTGSQVVFVVDFKNFRSDCKTVTTWRGNLSGNAIPTRWVLVYSGGSRPQIFRGSDRFQLR
jgi:hypothetical protein